MKKNDLKQATLAGEAGAAAEQEKQPFVEPKLTFVEPKLVKQGDVVDITAGFFGTFSP